MTLQPQNCSKDKIYPSIKCKLRRRKKNNPYLFKNSIRTKRTLSNTTMSGHWWPIIEFHIWLLLNLNLIACFTTTFQTLRSHHFRRSRVHDCRPPSNREVEIWRRGRCTFHCRYTILRWLWLRHDLNMLKKQTQLQCRAYSEKL